MSGEEKHFYQFKSFRLDVGERQLLHNDVAVPLQPKVFDVLAALVERGGHLIEKDELLRLVWSDSFVEEANVARIVHTLRKVLGEDENGNKFIETVAKKGYRFVAEVKEVSEPGEPKPNSRQSAAAVSSRNDANGQLPSAFRQLLAETNPPATAGGSDLSQKHTARIVLFTIGFLSAVGLIFLLSFDFQTASSANPNGVKSIAVLPVKPLTAENRDSIYENGIQDALINKLSLVKGLKVRSLSATRQYADISQDALAVGREQQVDYVLASNYQIADGKIRVTSQLINVQSGQVEEVFAVEENASNRFAVQDAVTANLGQSLLKRLNREPNNLSPKHSTTNEEAYRLYLLGTALADKRDPKAAEKAVDYFEQAVRLDPNYALAYAGLANAQTAVAVQGGGEMSEQHPKAKAAIEKALAIDDHLAEAHSYSGEIKWVGEWDFAGAEREHKKAVALNPNSSVAHRMYALYLGSMGRFDEAVAEINAAVDLEPASELNQRIYGQTLFYARRYDEAIARLKQTLEMNSDFTSTHFWLIAAYRKKGDDDQAFEWFIQLQTKNGQNGDELQTWRTIYAKSGWRGVFERQLEQAKEAEKNGKPSYMQSAFHSIELGERDAAFAYLEKAFVKRQWQIVTLAVNPRFDAIRSDARFEDLVRRVGLK